MGLLSDGLLVLKADTVRSAELAEIECLERVVLIICLNNRLIETGAYIDLYTCDKSRGG